MAKKITRGWEGAVRIADDEKGLKTAKDQPMQSAPVTKDTAIDSKFVIGQRSPYAILEGAETVSGSFTRPFEDDFFARLAGVQEKGEIKVPETHVIGIFPEGFKDGKDALIIKNARFGTWSVDLAPDDIVDEDIDWVAEDVVWKKVEDVGYEEYVKSAEEEIS
jgi:hypothetical protein